jgi:hypothetical protein
LIVSDINRIIIRTNYTNLPTRTINLTLDDLLKPESIKILRTTTLLEIIRLLENKSKGQPGQTLLQLLAVAKPLVGLPS